MNQIQILQPNYYLLTGKLASLNRNIISLKGNPPPLIVIRLKWYKVQRL